MTFRWPALLIGLAALALVACGGGGEKGGIAVETAVTGTATSTPTPTPAPTQRFSTSGAPVARLVIPAIGVDRPTVDGLVDRATNEMIAPDGPWDIAYYTYSAHPGHGNAVFSGHVDYINIGRVVFGDLNKLKEGDAVIVRLSDGAELRYAVRFNRVYAASTGPWGELFARDAAPDALTLYTCDGDFNRATQDYSERRVVRAERVG